MKKRRELSQNEQLHKAFFENSADAIFILTEDLTIIDTNQAACDRLRYARAELVGMNAAEINAPASRPQMLRLADQLATAGAARGEVIHVTKDGQAIPVEINSRQISLDGTDVILTVARDISDRKAIENQLLQSQQHFRLVFDNSGTSNSFFDLSGNLVLCNQLCSSLMGYNSTDEPVGKSLPELFGERQGTLFYERLTKAATERAVQIYVTAFAIESQQTWLQTSYIPLISESDEVVGVQLVSQDITKQKRYENDLNAAKTTLEEQVAERTQHLEVVLARLQEAQNSIVENEKLAVLGRLSASVAHEVNSPLAAIQSSNGTIKRSFDSVLNDLFRVFSSLSEESRTQLFELLRQSEERLRDSISTGLRSVKLKLVKELAEQNIPDSENTAEALLQLGLHKLDPAWLPLLSIDKRHEVLDMATHVSSLYRSTNIIAMATGKATEFVRALRKFAYKDNTHDSPEWFDLAGNIETVILLLKGQLTAGIELVRDFQSRPLVWGFPNLLLQVWSNLIQNAVQAMDDKGVLTIGITAVEGGVVVAITDTGKGIPEHLREKIFEPFFTTKNVDKGTGLGLGIVTDALTHNRGYLEFDSEPGRTTFRVVLPLETN